MDERFLSRSYVSTAVVLAAAVLCALAFHQAWVALSITLGTVLGIGVLAAYDVALRRIAVPGARRPGRSLLKLMAVKYILIGIMLYFIVDWGRISLPAFCGGILLSHLAIAAGLVYSHIRSSHPSAGTSLPVSRLGDS